MAMYLSENDKIITEGLTYDDVLLIPNYSEVLPKEVVTSTRFSRNVTLNIPLVSAAMDTVTEASMAIAIAREGGIGVLHKNMTIEQQKNQIMKVKRAESQIIKDPITLFPHSTIGDAKRNMRENSIGGIPIVDKDGYLVGIVTNRDLRFEHNDNKLLSQVMTPKEKIVTAKANITKEEAEKMLEENKIEKLPVVNKDNKLVGLVTFRDIHKIQKKPYTNRNQEGTLRVAAALGVTADVIERATALADAGVDALVIDTAHGHTKGVVEVLKKVKKNFPNVDVVVGNVATAEAAVFLAEAGADAVKVGIGPGSICTTRIVAGVGFPQLSAVINVSKAIKKGGYNIPVIADGGIKYTGDIAKAIAGGADCVMLGSLLAGVKEAPGQEIIYEGRQYKVYRGMGSIDAMQSGSKDRYFQDMEADIKKLVPEGIEGRVPYKGELQDSVHQMIGGLRASMGYCGAATIEELQEKGRFVKITSSGISESHPHSVTITKEAPNYSR